MVLNSDRSSLGCLFSGEAVLGHSYMLFNMYTYVLFYFYTYSNWKF
jgi:hypothetical protein